jgi:hypothetical protein
MTYIPALDLYIMPQWSYRHMEYLDRWGMVQFEFYQAPAPWGPWTLFHRQNFEAEGWYDPCIPSKFISEDGLRFWLFVSGRCCSNSYSSAASWEAQKKFRGPSMIPVTLEVAS